MTTGDDWLVDPAAVSSLLTLAGEEVNSTVFHRSNLAVFQAELSRWDNKPRRHVLLIMICAVFQWDPDIELVSILVIPGWLGPAYVIDPRTSTCGDRIVDPVRLRALARHVEAKLAARGRLGREVRILALHPA